MVLETGVEKRTAADTRPNLARLSESAVAASGSFNGLGDDEGVPVICTTCQVVAQKHPCGRLPATLHGVVFDILDEEPQARRRAGSWRARAEVARHSTISCDKSQNGRVDRFSAVEHDPLTYNPPDRHRRLHRTYVSVPRSLDHVRFGSMSFRAILARQKRPSPAHMAVTRHRFAASRATNPKSHSPLAVFAARELMTSGALRPVRHRLISSVQLPIKLESARTPGGSGTLRR